MESDITKTHSVKDKNDTFYVYFAKKTERLAAAVYRLSDLMDEDEQLRKDLKDRALKTISLASGFASETRRDSFSVRDSVTEVFSEIISLLRLGSNSCGLSHANVDLIETEYGDLIKLLYERKQTLHFSPSFFTADVERPSVLLNTDLGHNNVSEAIHNKRHQKDTNNVFERSSSIDRPKQQNERSNLILSIIKKKKEVGIKDIAEFISGVGEKTIQRDLLALVSQGVLEKKGERRWSRYFLPEERKM